MPKLLIFAGTTEGRHLVEILSKTKGLQVFASVATEYGRALLPGGIPNVIVKSGRMLPEEMEQFLRKEQFDFVIDTTHPYAVLATENIREACTKTDTAYIRLLRASTDLVKTKYHERESSKSQTAMDCEEFIFAEDVTEAAEYLNQTQGAVLLTIGSKELEAFTRVENYAQRLHPRVLPMPEVLKKCADLGYEGKNLICMQGPFSYEMNCALLKKTKASYMVTKDSGKAGGFDEKYRAAMDMGVKVLLIGRKKEEQGLSLQEVLLFLEKTYHLNLQAAQMVPGELEAESIGNAAGEEEKSGWFPLFINLAEQAVTVIGAGKIAKRRVKVLEEFSCKITVIAKEADSFFTTRQDEKRLTLLTKEFEEEDIREAMLVIAATNDRFINHTVAEICKREHILVNVADCKEECDFYFPGVVRKGDLTIGVTAGGKDHALAKSATAALKAYLENHHHLSVKREESENGTKKD
ncbi:precorrin-6A reductase [Sinanaerobacter sp. ZZT-01]|uniref:precorrin-6A reductase n=1 Tax=Sinanaerobacter sp. ZZT-01 TaxID=3111540 RepID=UPI002D772BA7|nr:precorrin-6A reductase [Sinanaerobacter sp. ZZT-01]WRR94668.1 precorrin-6A reductase [Sinanaerobacter sp. ZZT-01]